MNYINQSNKASDIAKNLLSLGLERWGNDAPTTTMITLWDDESFQVIIRNGIKLKDGTVVFREYSFVSTDDFPEYHERQRKDGNPATLRTGFEEIQNLKKS